MSIEDCVANLEQAFLALNRLAKRDDERHESVAESIRLLTEMIARHNERFEQVEADQSNADQRIAALADAQIKTEEAFADAQIKIEEAFVRLSEAQARTEATVSSLAQKVDALVDIVQQGRNGNS